MFYGESIVMRSFEKNDDRQALLGLDRVKGALDQNLKIHNLIGADVQVNINAVQVNQFDGWPDAAVFALNAFYEALKARKTVSEAIAAVVESETPRALRPGRSDEAA